MSFALYELAIIHITRDEVIIIIYNVIISSSLLYSMLEQGCC